jgi:hypothetical protein
MFKSGFMVGCFGFLRVDYLCKSLIYLGINDKIALGSNVSWSIPIGGNFDSKKDSAMLSGRVTIVSAQDIFEPSISFGLTEFSPDMSLGMSWSRKF